MAFNSIARRMEKGRRKETPKEFRACIFWRIHIAKGKVDMTEMLNSIRLMAMAMNSLSILEPYLLIIHWQRIDFLRLKGPNFENHHLRALTLNGKPNWRTSLLRSQPFNRSQFCNLFHPIQVRSFSWLSQGDL
ncbi:hypothetical protein Ancab_004742 [Ancistrocladus abbreviatus]